MNRQLIQLGLMGTDWRAIELHTAGGMQRRTHPLTGVAIALVLLITNDIPRRLVQPVPTRVTARRD
jgi:hypothetical protein